MLAAVEVILPLFFGTRFAPHSPQSLAASFRGAKSSQRFRAVICLRRLFQRRALLPAPRKALLLRFGEQNLHRNSAPPSASAAFSAARFAPRSPQSLAASFRGAKSSQRFRAAICHRRPFQRRDLLPAPRKALRLRFGEQNLHRSSAPPSATGDSCWRRPAGKAIYHRRAPPTGRPKSRPAADHVGAASPAKPYIAVGPRQQGTQNPARRPTMLAPPRRQSLMPSSGHANRAPKIPLGGRPCWRRSAGKAIYRRRATPTGRPKTRLPADPVGAAPPAKPYITVGPRQQGTQIPPGGRPCWRCPADKAIYHRRAAPTGRPICKSKEKDCRYLSILKSMG